MMIPGLDFCPAVEDDMEEGSDLFSFTGTFRIPRSQSYGACRPIAEFRKLSCLKATNSWVLRKCFDTKKQERVCVKKYKDSEMDERNIIKDLDKLRIEVAILCNLKHDNIMQFYEPAVGDAFENIYLIYECCEYFLSDLMDQNVAGLYEIPMVKNAVHQLFQGLDYIHKNSIMHRDINPKNIMYRRDGVLKLANFRNARKFGSRNLKLDVTFKNYQAPEVLLNAEEQHGPGIDIWAVGCIFAELYLKKNVFPGRFALDVFKSVIDLLGVPNDAFWPGCSSLPSFELLRIEKSQPYNGLKQLLMTSNSATKESLEMLTAIFMYNPKYRLTARECLSHLYFSEDPKAYPIEEVADFLQASELLQKMESIAIPSIITTR